MFSVTIRHTEVPTAQCPELTMNGPYLRNHDEYLWLYAGSAIVIPIHHPTPCFLSMFLSSCKRYQGIAICFAALCTKEDTALNAFLLSVHVKCCEYWTASFG